MGMQSAANVSRQIHVFRKIDNTHLSAKSMKWRRIKNFLLNPNLAEAAVRKSGEPPHAEAARCPGTIREGLKKEFLKTGLRFSL